MNLLRRIQYNQNWNIGICEQTPEELIQSKSLNPVRWMKHPYKDRWFADPFILKVTEKDIVVFVEERKIDGNKGYLSELTIDRNTVTLKERHVILELDSHLSYPAIIRRKDKTYVYPENALGGPLKMYEYDKRNHQLVNPKMILDESVADSTILEYNDRFFLIATKYPESQEKAYLFHSELFNGKYKLSQTIPVQSDRSCSRPGGNWFTVDGQLYRPAQDCHNHYGGALSIMKIETLVPFKESLEFQITPLNFKYNLGVHTLNFCDGIAVVDGYGYLHPLLGRMYYSKLVNGVRNFIKHHNRQ